MARVGALFSGGKDSTYAAWLASKRDRLMCLITLFPKSESSYMFHYPNIRWTSLQAKAAGVPQLTMETPGVKEQELSQLSEVLKLAKEEYDVQAIYTGALASVYQKSRVEKACGDLGLECRSPLWGLDPEIHLRTLVKDGFVSIVVSVSALGLDKSWLGRKVDESAIAELVALGSKFRFHIGFEGGEGETFVTECPLFASRIHIDNSAIHWSGDSGYLEILRASLEAK